MLRHLATALLFFGAFACQISYSQVQATKKYSAFLGYRVMIETKIFHPNFKCVVFINLHDNENTSVEAGETYLNAHGGKLVQLKHSGERNIHFKVRKAKFSFDPNRIFTTVGIAKTIKSPTVKHYLTARKKVKGFAAEILTGSLKNVKVIVSLHNNSEGLYSIESYLPLGDESRNAAEVYRNPLMDSDDFVYTTDRGIFDFLKNRQINAVLQSDQAAVDDGSLSIYSALNKLTYINIEAQEGHLEEQIRILNEMSTIFQGYK